MMGRCETTSAGNCPLEQLETALAEERRALLEHDALRLLDSSQAKRTALMALESNPPYAQTGYLARLREANRVNGVLLGQRRRSLRELNHNQGAPGYDAHGLVCSWQNRHSLAVA